MENRVINKNIEQQGEVVKITETVENTYTKADLIRMKDGLMAQKEQLIRQSKNIKKRYDDLTQQENEVNSLIKRLEVEQPGTLEEIGQ